MRDITRVTRPRLLSPPRHLYLPTIVKRLRLDPSRKPQVPSQLHLRDATLRCRTWLRVAFTKPHSFRIGIAVTSRCDSCNGDETVEHLLCLCNRFVPERNVLRTAPNRLDGRLSSLEKTLGSCSYAPQASKATQALMLFLKSTGLSDRL